MDFSDYFAEEFVEGDRRSIRSLNPNKKTHRQRFVKKFAEFLDIINVENELNEVSVNFNGAKIEQIHNDINCVMRKSRNEVEGPIIKIEKSVEKRKLRALIAHWKEIVHEKDENICRRESCRNEWTCLK